MGERGQVAVEAALVMPLFVVLLLGVVQLAALQQARLLTDYAAFSAARAGIVWNGSNARMRDAALVALLPTQGRTDGIEAFGRTWTDARAQDAAFQKLPWAGPAEVNGSPLRGQVRVDTVSPVDSPELGKIWNVRGGESWEELDFDAPQTLSEASGLAEHESAVDDPTREDPSQVTYREANVLRIRVRYLYELRVPLANLFVFTSWFASNSGGAVGGPLERPTLRRGASGGVLHEHGLPSLTADELGLLWDLSTGARRLESGGGARRYFIPLSATYSMRMQSNFHRKWLMHSAAQGQP